MRLQVDFELQLNKFGRKRKSGLKNNTTVTLHCSVTRGDPRNFGRCQSIISLNGDLVYVKKGLHKYYFQPETSPFLSTQMARPYSSFSVL